MFGGFLGFLCGTKRKRHHRRHNHHSGPCRTGCSSTSSLEQGVRFYTPQESLPIVEDFGETQLVAGHAYVRIDPSFGETMDQHAQYLVFITPEGDANTLFVTQKSASGFSVTESRGGRDSISFQYRIVAKPYGVQAARLERFAIPDSRPRHHGHTSDQNEFKLPRITP